MKPSLYPTARQLFLTALVANFFNDNAFLLRSQDWSPFANGKTVSWNQEGAPPDAKFNSTDGYGSATSRTDVLRTFDLDELITRPQKVNWTEQQVINYNFMVSAMRNHLMKAKDDVALRILYRWVQGLHTAAPGNVLRTSGSAKVAAAPGATGNRKKVTYEDFVKAQTTFNKKNIPQTGRLVVVPADMYGDLLLLEQFIKLDYVSNPVVQTGQVGRILNFDVYVHATGVVFSNASTPAALIPKADDEFTPYAGSATDNQAAIFYHESEVVRAVSPDSLVSLIDAHGGSELSTTALSGGAVFHKDYRGVVALVESAAA